MRAEFADEACDAAGHGGIGFLLESIRQ